MPNYKVKWEIDIEADTPADAARQALEVQRDLESTATVFEVEGKEYDVDPDLPRIFDSLSEDDENSVMDRYTVITGMENGWYHFLGCSIGGRAFSQWGEIRQGDIEGDLTNLGREITMQQLDQDTRNHIVSRINE